MKILIKSIFLFLFGLYVEMYKKHFDSVMDKCIKNGGNISSDRLTKMSDKCYRLYVKFKEYEKELNYEVNLNKIIKEYV